MLVGRGREIDGKGRAAGGKCFGLDVPSVLANDGHADAEPQAGAAPGTLGGVNGIEDAAKRDVRIPEDSGRCARRGGLAGGSVPVGAWWNHRLLGDRGEAR